MLTSLTLYLCLCIGLTIQAPVCTPTITEGQIGKPEIGGFISLECEIATCNNPTKIVFEKTDFNETWIPVFEGISTTQYKALDTAVEYTLEKRNYYYAFRTSVHSLHIVPLILKDHGEWRCVVYDVKETRYNSGPIDINVYVSPGLEKFNINPNNSQILFHQTKEFTCVVDGIHPEPEVLWKVNGAVHKGNVISQQRTDQLWVVRNTIRLRFDTLGINKLNCVLKAKAKDPWMECHINITVQAPLCTPTLTEGQHGNPNLGGFISLECEVATCNNLTKLVFEKMDLNASWTPIFEGVNQTCHKALDTATDYTIKNRSYYYAYLTNVKSLHIIPLMLHDYGKWRCVVNDVSGKTYKSGPLDVNVYVQPAVDDFYINPNRSHLVIGQTQEYTCVANGIHPEPEVLWKVNGIEHKGNAISQQQADQLWVVINTIVLKWDIIGVNQLYCVLQTKGKDPWLKHHIDITVQEKAVVLYPLHDITITVELDATFSLRCSVSGYNPRITWMRNGGDYLSNSTRYTINDECDTTKCESSITSQPMDLALACDNQEQYSGVYKCGVTLAPPYQSSATSSNMNVTFLKRQCDGKPSGQIIGLSMMSALVVALIATVIGIYLNRKMKIQAQRDREEQSLRLLDVNSTSVDIDFYKGMEMQCIIAPGYETVVYLKKCETSQGDDKLVLFDFQNDHIFMHEMSDLKKYTVYICDVNIVDMLHLSNNKFVVTEYQKRQIHLFHLIEGTFHKLDTLKQHSDRWRPLICADTETSFILCDISGHEPYDITISRGDITNDELKKNLIARVMLNTRPTYVSLTPDRRMLVMVNDRATIYMLDLKSFNLKTDHNLENKDVDGWVRSLYIDQRANIVIGDRSQIIVYTHDRKRHVVQIVGERVRGVTVKNERIIVNYGINGQQQYIRVYTNNALTQFQYVEKNISDGINFYKSMEKQYTITPDYKTAVYLKKCFNRQGDDKLVLFDFQKDRIFIHEMSDLNNYKEYKCAVNILDMIRISHNRYVVTEHINRNIHLLHFQDEQCHTLDTLSQDFDDWHALICAYKDNSFIWCDLEGHEPYVIEISLIDIHNDKLCPNRIKDITLTTRPRYISVKSDNSMLVLVDNRATICMVDLESFELVENVENKDIDGWVRSLYIDQCDNIIIGDGSQINVYTHDKQSCIAPRVGDPVQGVTVNNGRIIVLCGYKGQEQYIKVYEQHCLKAPLSGNEMKKSKSFISKAT